MKNFRDGSGNASGQGWGDGIGKASGQGWGDGCGAASGRSYTDGEGWGFGSASAGRDLNGEQLKIKWIFKHK